MTEVSAGEIKDGVHHMGVRAYLEDTDAGGVVYHAGYLRFMERGRTDYLRVCGFSHSAFMSSQNEGTLHPGQILLVVRHMEIDFRMPALLDDTLMVETSVVRVGGASIIMHQAVTRGRDTLVTAVVKVGVIDADKRPARMPAALRERLLEEIKS